MEPEVAVNSAIALCNDKSEHVAVLRDGEFRIRLSSEVEVALKIDVFDAREFSQKRIRD